jgi:hypothetical protein
MNERYEPGERVVDRDDEPDRRTPMRVVEHHNHEARHHHLGDLGASVYLLNQDYPPDATVVDVIYEPALTDALDDAGFSFDKTAAVARHYDLATYSFPAPRLERIEEESAGEAIEA